MEVPAKEGISKRQQKRMAKQAQWEKKKELIKM
jgi:hypothetical protein